MSPVKEQARELVARLPEDATWSDLVYEIELRRKVEAGLRDLDEGRSTPHEDVRKQFLDRSRRCTIAENPKRCQEVITMVQPAIKQQILDDLDQLSPEQQKRAAELVHGLLSPLPKGASIHDLKKVSGILDDESAREMMEAIEEGCEQIDLNEW